MLRGCTERAALVSKNESNRIGTLHTVAPGMYPCNERVGQPVIQAEANACAQIKPNDLIYARTRRDDAYDEEEEQAVGGEQMMASISAKQSRLQGQYEHRGVRSIANQVTLCPLGVHFLDEDILRVQ